MVVVLLESGGMGWVGQVWNGFGMGWVGQEGGEVKQIRAGGKSRRKRFGEWKVFQRKGSALMQLIKCCRERKRTGEKNGKAEGSERVKAAPDSAQVLLCGAVLSMEHPSMG